MGGGDKHFLNEVLVPLLDSGNALAASLLYLVLAYGLTLDIADVSKGDNAVLNGDKVLNIDLTADIFDRSSSLVGVLLLYLFKLNGNNFKHLCVITENFGKLLYLCVKLGKFVFYLLALHI